MAQNILLGLGAAVLPGVLLNQFGINQEYIISQLEKQERDAEKRRDALKKLEKSKSDFLISKINPDFNKLKNEPLKSVFEPRKISPKTRVRKQEPKIEDTKVEDTLKTIAEFTAQRSFDTHNILTANIQTVKRGNKPILANTQKNEVPIILNKESGNLIKGQITTVKRGSKNFLPSIPEFQNESLKIKDQKQDLKNLSVQTRTKIKHSNNSNVTNKIPIIKLSIP